MVPPSEAAPDRRISTLYPADLDDGLLDFTRHLPDLLDRVARDRDPTIFPDGKAIVDSTPIQPLGRTVVEYAVRSTELDFNPNEFFLRHFERPSYKVPDLDRGELPTVQDYIKHMWGVLAYDAPHDRGTLIGTPNTNLRPGQRFGEAYYWDLADAARGLLIEADQSPAPERDIKERLVLGVANNLAYQVDRFGYVPNGLRSYYLGRSQPPVFAGIVKGMASHFGERRPDLVEEYLPALTTEYEWWMRSERIAEMPDGSVLNHHWDSNNTPRPESYQEDVETAARAPRVEPTRIYRDLRAAAESGRDFTARFLRDPYRLETIHTTDFATPELNAMLYEYETLIADAHQVAGRSVLAKDFKERAASRAESMDKYLWNPQDGCYYDYDYVAARQSNIKSMATAYPVARGVASPEQARAVAHVLRTDLLKRGGFVSTLVESDGQWDGSNGWVRDQIEGIDALTVAGDDWNAAKAAGLWTRRERQIYQIHGALFEKNDVVNISPRPGRGGEYPVQQGFLMTNAGYRVLRKVLDSRVIVSAA